MDDARVIFSLTILQRSFEPFAALRQKQVRGSPAMAPSKASQLSTRSSMHRKKMEVIYELNENQMQELHELCQNEWWTKGRSIDETRECVNGSQINIGIVDDEGSLQAYARVLTDYTFKALIFDIIVSKKHRGTGLGEQLINRWR